MKKIKITVMAAFIMLLLAGCGDSGEKVHVYNWGDYIDRQTIDMFQKETGIKVVYEVFDSNETMYAKVKSSPSSYDVLFPSEYMFSRMMSEELLQPINWDNVPNIKHINPLFRETRHDPDGAYCAAYMRGTLGIIYNKTMVDDPVESWDILWNDKYKKQIYMYNSVRDTMAVSLKRLGYSLNSIEADELNKAKDELIQQKPLVQAYLVDQIKDKMIGEEGALAVVYSGDAVYCKEENDDLEYVVPIEGSNLWYDGMVIPKEAKNVANAEKFINFMCRPDIAAINTEYIGYSTANLAALELLDEELTENYIFNPTQEEIERCEMFDDIGEGRKIYDDIWNEILTSKK